MTQPLLPRLPNDVVTSCVFPFLTPEEQKKTELINKAWNINSRLTQDRRYYPINTHLPISQLPELSDIPREIAQMPHPIMKCKDSQGRPAIAFRIKWDSKEDLLILFKSETDWKVKKGRELNQAWSLDSWKEILTQILRNPNSEFQITDYSPPANSSPPSAPQVPEQDFPYLKFLATAIYVVIAAGVVFAFCKDP